MKTETEITEGILHMELVGYDLTTISGLSPEDVEVIEKMTSMGRTTWAFSTEAHCLGYAAHNEQHAGFLKSKVHGVEGVESYDQRELRTMKSSMRQAARLIGGSTQLDAILESIEPQYFRTYLYLGSGPRNLDPS